jgi:HEPN domain
VKSFTEKQGYKPVDLLHAASDHLFSANTLFSAGGLFDLVGIISIEAPRCFDSAGYLSHLGIELMLKALLLSQARHFPDEHSLNKLLIMIQSSGAVLSIDSGDKAILSKLDQFAKLRYPDPNGVGLPSIGEDDWPMIHRLWSKLFDQLPEIVKREACDIDRSMKFGRQLMRKLREGSPLEGHVAIVETQKAVK